ncbi:MAG: IS66 family transposase [Methanosarcinaceae archaeon]
MVLTRHDLAQIDIDYLKSLTPEELLAVSLKLLHDLQEAHDRLNQTPDNSSRPPSSFAPWEGTVIEDDEKEEGQEENKTTSKSNTEEEKEETPKDESKPEPKKSGKPKGAEGHGREIEREITGIEEHRAEKCALCGKELEEDAEFTPRTGFYVLDIEVGENGIEITYVKHLHGDTLCSCGHETRTKPARCKKEEDWNTELTEWRLVGPMLAALIVSLSFRSRMSRLRIQEFLRDWLGIRLSKGTINNTIREAGQAVEPLEEELIEEVKKAELLYSDETSWKENGVLRWLWVLVTANVTLFLIGKRSWDVIASILESYAGWLMSDGYMAYRKYAKRLRCWAHLIRKARGLSESINQEASSFGTEVLKIFTLLIKQIYKAREGPDRNLKEEYASKLEKLKKLCEKHKDSKHDKTRKLARELLNDWDTIWTVLEHTELPITNNIAERALRHWIIFRKISFGTRSKEGSRVFCLLASVIETCRQRDILPWPYLAEVIAQRRKGNSAPILPATSL